MKNVAPEDARKAAGLLYAYAAKVDARHKSDPKEQQISMDLPTDITWFVIRETPPYNDYLPVRQVTYRIVKADITDFNTIVKYEDVVGMFGDEESATEYAERMEERDF